MKSILFLIGPYLTLLYLSVSTRSAIGQVCGPYFPEQSVTVTIVNTWGAGLAQW